MVAHNPSGDAADVLLAKATLIALRASLRTPPSGHGFMLSPSEEVITFAAAAEALARMPKPLQCTAESRGDILRVQCRTLTTAAEAWIRQYVLPVARAVYDPDDAAQRLGAIGILLVGWVEGTFSVFPRPGRAPES